MAKMQLSDSVKKIPLKASHKRLFYYFYQQIHHRNYISWFFMHDLSGIKQHILSRIHKCSIPRAMLIDPTYECNLNCIGCYAAGYGKDEGLSFEELDDIISQAEKLGIHFFLYTGGEPLMRKYDLVKIAKKHKFSIFHAFTNGTMIDEAYADEVAKIENLTFGFGVEGFREETDFRRGEGTYDKIMEAMDLLKQRGVAFAFASCFHPKNYEIVTSDEFIDLMIEKGCWAGWYFTYLPVGQDASLELVCDPEQRAYVSNKVRKIREAKKINVIDFWNDGYMVGGCIAGGRQYIHINSRGDVEPCAFCHYSDSNIRNMSLLEALKSPFLKKFRSCQPFNDNPFMACPVLDNPEKLVDIVNRTKARSTEMCAEENVEDLAKKTKPISQKWQHKADELYETLSMKDKKMSKQKQNYYSKFKK